MRAVGPYGGWLRRAVIAFKYGEEWARAAHLGDALAGAAGEVGPIDAVVPVPLHPERLRERGFNQSLLLAKRVGTQTGIPVMEALLRTRPTPRQVGLGANERAVNVRGAFAGLSGANFAGKRIALVDDVCTTGATLGSCAEVLLGLGASEVIGLTLAKEF